MAIDNRYEFLFYIQCRNGNPNGDPDMGNAPRMDPQDLHGYVTDVAIKRRIRNYVQAAYAGKPGMEMLIRSASNINTGLARAKEHSAPGHFHHADGQGRGGEECQNSRRL